MISVLGVSVSRGNATIIREMDFRAEPGTVTALIGPNGSGKSTLVAAISADLPVTTGHIRLLDHDVAELAPTEAARLRAVMTQASPVAFGFDAGEVVAMGRTPWRNRAEAEQDDEAVRQAMTATDIGHLWDRPVQSLSGGEQARVALARTLAQATPIIILDEPTASLDLRHQVDTLKCLAARASAGATVLVVLHDLTLAAAFSHHLVLLAEGRVAASGTTHQVLQPTVLEPVYGLPLQMLSHPRTGTPIVVPA